MCFHRNLAPLMCIFAIESCLCFPDLKYEFSMSAEVCLQCNNAVHNYYTSRTQSLPNDSFSFTTVLFIYFYYDESLTDLTVLTRIMNAEVTGKLPYVTLSVS